MLLCACNIFWVKTVMQCKFNCNIIILQTKGLLYYLVHKFHTPKGSGIYYTALQPYHTSILPYSPTTIHPYYHYHTTLLEYYTTRIANNNTNMTHSRHIMNPHIFLQVDTFEFALWSSSTILATLSSNTASESSIWCLWTSSSNISLCSELIETYNSCIVCLYQSLYNSPSIQKKSSHLWGEDYNKWMSK